MWGVNAYPINLIKIVGFENNAAHDTGTVSGLHGDGDITEEDVEVGLNGRSITTLGNGESSTIGRVSVDSSGGGSPLVQVLGEVEVQGRLSGTLIGGTSLLEGIARSVGLS